MRPGAEYPMAHGPAAAPRSTWQTPVPYLFGGLAAMLGLIALSLLTLACSYWKLSGGLAGPDEDQPAGSDGEKGSPSPPGPAREWLRHVVVIMAGDEQPSFLATPASMTSRAADAGAETADGATACCAACRSEERKMADAREAGSEDGAQSPSELASSSTSSVLS
ncbi:protein GLUTAMINE DUMPER 2-like [Hordeum vulgare subsp. vulgare]|uniref:Predicted protein n=1 Tax=Hordeum vulgare subsp. vulgare TaxID=112509 RepID=F2D7R4_HORVV|nr:protein GLUTAMINE DUMPER 2-like [Hordeum vulgare subsp. vulgare]KAI4978036.1 hypothetical protein ZWY2020_014590 [Hordeum vulgare]BAJ91135.1 predicted protein [Hordeum vulgare subsp. vulgare]BAJ97274.1 predicted protein [Hordeum vulgare subsp. vulgare]